MVFTILKGSVIMNYEIKINEFEGPLDLLLHLIKESNIDIYDISIEDVTKQYLDYINKMENLNLSIASEYLVMAAELIEMKSKLLLPKKEKNSDETSIEEDRENLINRLIEYQKYKEIAPKLKEFKENRESYFTKSPCNLNDYKSDSTDVILDADLNLLLESFQKYLQRKKEDKPLNTVITKKELSVHDRSIKIKNILKNKKSVLFEDLFDEISKPYIVVTFLSLLNLVKSREVLIKQEDNFGNIKISLWGEEKHEL